MVKQYFLWFASIFLLACDNGGDRKCFESQGTYFSEVVNLGPFRSIEVNGLVETILVPSDQWKMEWNYEIGLRDAVSYQIANEKLIITNSSDCALQFMPRKLFVTIYYQELESIYNFTPYGVRSEVPIIGENLTLVAENFSHSLAMYNSGFFDLEFFGNSLTALANGSAQFHLRGNVEHAYFQLYSGNARIEAQHLSAHHIDILHRSYNHIFCSPEISITGEIRSTGNVYISELPPIHSITSFYSGQLIVNGNE